jgi:acyl transferase domain-containing protein
LHATPEAPEPHAGAIAIVGMAARFPDSPDLATFWDNLKSGRECIRDLADADLQDGLADVARSNPAYVRRRPVLDGIENFDAAFFGMSPREAALTDPQQRVFLECTWNALEDAAIDPARAQGPIGVFAGSALNTYFLRHVCADQKGLRDFTADFQVGHYQELLGAMQDFVASRVAYKLDLKGPAVTVQSACSTSLLAVAQACQSLQLFQCDAALAGGVSISVPQMRGYESIDGGMVSADGHVRPFDAAANGTVFGSGCGVVVLKRLEDALADGDRIYAVIRGAGVNNDGSAKVGFTAPSIDGQAQAIMLAHANAGVTPADIGYVEAHGTATPLGDPIEFRALAKAFTAAAPHAQACRLGSLKANFGHLDAAAGVAGLIKTALALDRQEVPPQINFTAANPEIDLAASPFRIETQATPWTRTDRARMAGVSAFGVGGTNVHLVLEEAPRRATEAKAEATGQAL